MSAVKVQTDGVIKLPKAILRLRLTLPSPWGNEVLSSLPKRRIEN